MSTSTIDQGNLTIAVPLTIRKRGGRALILLLDGEETTAPARRGSTIR
jgi:hypothetical protein